MKVLIIGQGGREHALAWKVKKSPRVKRIYCASGNGGTARVAANVPIRSDDTKALMRFAEDEKIDLTIVGPEAPLALGVVDSFREKGLRVFGPTKAASALESSKIFTKLLARDMRIPTADFEIFDKPDKAKDYVRSQKYPVVIKADGLAQGKGVIVAKDKNEAESAIDRIMVEKAFGHAGDRIIVEECLRGEEASIIVISDGENVVPLASSQDHKRLHDGDKGPNTGGMGAYSPAPVVTDKIFSGTITDMIGPAIRGMKEKGAPLSGVLYAGIMITENGPKLLEFNVRFGDPETQAILPRLESDFVEMIEASIDGLLKGHELAWNDKSCVSVVMASGGYPGKYEKEKKITGLDKVRKLKETFVFHAGTKLVDNNVLTTGGRVLNVVALGSDIKEAIDKVYLACGEIKFEGAHYRRDIGHRALKREVVS